VELKKGFMTGLMRWMLWLFKTYALSAGMYACQIWSTQFLKHDNVFSNPLQVAHMAFKKRILGIKSTSANWCVLYKCTQEPLQFYWFGSAVKFWNRMVDSKSNTLRDVMKADISLGNSGASNCWTAFGDLQKGTVYRSELLHCRKLNISNLRIGLRFRHQAVWREAHGQDPCSCLNSLWLITIGLLCLRDRFLMHVHHLSCQSI
jgi:hypothetical protein